MQSRPTRRLAQILARTLKKTSFRETAKMHKILTEDGRPDPGMVKQLVKGYEPMKISTRSRLGLPPLPYCPECKRRTVQHHEHTPKPIADEPIRRVLSGAWRLPNGQWGNIKDLIKSQAD